MGMENCSRKICVAKRLYIYICISSIIYVQFKSICLTIHLINIYIYIYVSFQYLYMCRVLRTHTYIYIYKNEYTVHVTIWCAWSPPKNMKPAKQFVLGNIRLGFRCPCGHLHWYRFCRQCRINMFFATNCSYACVRNIGSVKVQSRTIVSKSLISIFHGQLRSRLQSTAELLFSQPHDHG